MLALGATRNPTRSFGYAVTAQVLLAGVCVYLIPVVIYPSLGYRGVFSFLMVLVALVLPLVRFIPRQSAPATAAKQARSTQWLCWLALVVMAVYFVGLNGNWAFLELLGERVGLGTESIGIAISVGLVGGAAGSMAASIFHDRVSVKLAMTIAVIGFVIYVLAIGRGAGVWSYAGAVLIFNVVWNFSLPYQMGVIVRTDHHGRLLALLPAAQALGGALGPLLAGSVLLIAGPSGLYVQLLICVGVATLGFSWLDRRAG